MTDNYTNHSLKYVLKSYNSSHHIAYPHTTHKNDKKLPKNQKLKNKSFKIEFIVIHNYNFLFRKLQFIINLKKLHFPRNACTSLMITVNIYYIIYIVIGQQTLLCLYVIRSYSIVYALFFSGPSWSADGIVPDLPLYNESKNMYLPCIIYYIFIYL